MNGGKGDFSKIKADKPVMETCNFGLSASLKILLVDDNKINRKLLTSFLQRYKHRVIHAENGLEALEILAEQDGFDIVFMDVQMPVMDGLTASIIIRASEKGMMLEAFDLPDDLAEKLIYDRLKTHIPIVAMTANAMSGDKRKCLDVGMDDYLTKPFQQEHILSILSKIAGESALKAKGPADERPFNEQPISTVRKNTLKTVSDYLKNTYKFGDREIEQFLDLSCSSLSENFVKARAYAGDGNILMLGEVVHSLKGSLLNLGLHEYAARAQEIEANCKQGRKIACEKQLVDLQNNLSKLITNMNH